MRTLLASLTFLILATLSLLTAPAAFYLQVQAQPITSSALGGPGTTLLTTFPNGTSKVTWVNGTTVQFVNGVGVLIVDPSVSAAAAASASAPVSNTVVNRVYQAIAIAIGITINNNTNNTIFEPLLPPINETEPIPVREPDEQCLFDPSLPHCAPVDGECPEGFGINEEGQCFPRGGCPDGYHSVEDDESGTCYPDDIPCPDGQVRSEEGNYCIEPTEPEPEPVDCAPGFAFSPQSGECEPFSLPVQGEDEQEQGQQPVEEPVEESEGNQNDEESPPSEENEQQPEEQPEEQPDESNESDGENSDSNNDDGNNGGGEDGDDA